MENLLKDYKELAKSDALKVWLTDIAKYAYRAKDELIHKLKFIASKNSLDINEVDRLFKYPIETLDKIMELIGKSWDIEEENKDLNELYRKHKTK